MTLGIAITSARYAAVITDRRLSGGHLTDDSNKSGSIVYRDARLAYTYAGLAETGDFKARFWIAEQLARAAAPGVGVETGIKNFTTLATAEFRKVRLPARYGPAARRLSVVLTGYRLTALGQVVPAIYLVSNFEGVGQDTAGVWDEFRLWSEAPLPGCSGMLVIGARPSRAYFESVAELVKNPKVAPQHTINKAVTLIRNLSEREPAGTVGPQCSSVLISPNPGAPIALDYHPNKVATKTPVSSFVCAKYGAEGAYLMVDGSFEGANSGGVPLTRHVPTVARNKPCPCRSGKRFKHCHGGKAPLPFSPESFTVGTHIQLLAEPEDGRSIQLIGMTAAGLMVGGSA